MSSLAQTTKDTLKRVGNTVAGIVLKNEDIPGTEENLKRANELDSGYSVLKEWNDGDAVYSEIYNRLCKYRDFYVGEINQQWNNAIETEGNTKLVFNLGATIIDLFTYILSNQPPSMQFIPESADDMGQLKADFSEDLTRKLLDNAKFPKRFRDGVKTQFMLGFCWPFLLWNKDNKTGSDKGTLEISIINGFNARVKFKDNDYEAVESFTTMKRLSREEIKRRYSFEAVSDTEDVYIPKTIQVIDDDKTTVFRRYDDKTIKTVINGRMVEEYTHGYGFVPLIPVNNIFIPNDAHGYSEIEKWRGIAQELNALLTMASEIARDLAYPPILEYNNALGGRKIPKWRGQKIPVRRSDKGEAINFMVNPAQIQPIIKQAELLLELFHFVALMPKAAAGVFDANVTSGFQAKLAMQPATLTTENRKIDWNNALMDMMRMAFKILGKENPEALQVKLPNGNIFKFDDLDKQLIKIVWPDNLPMDIAREVQNLILGIQNNLTSVHQAIDRYNVLLGMGSATDTMAYLEQEKNNTSLNPQKATVLKKLEQLDAAINSAQGQMQQLQGQMGGGQLPSGVPSGVPPMMPGQPVGQQQNNPTNMARAAGVEGEKGKATSQSATPESVAPESTGGVLPNGGKL